MAFDTETQKTINEYLTAHLADKQWHKDRFDFINNNDLEERLADEFISARYIYKLLEGISAQSWLLKAQIKLQILSYASIYEAVLHHLLFDELNDRKEVIALTEFKTKKLISIPSVKLKILEKELEHNGEKIIPTYESIGRTDETKVRFDRKAECACKLGLIEDWLKDELIEFYDARNAIHIHAEIRKSLEYQIDLSKRAYRRMEPFIEQLKINYPNIKNQQII